VKHVSADERRKAWQHQLFSNFHLFTLLIFGNIQSLAAVLACRWLCSERKLLGKSVHDQFVFKTACFVLLIDVVLVCMR